MEGVSMRNEEITLQVPECKEDCSKIECRNCYSLIRFMQDDICFNCFNPRKSNPFWRD